MQNLAGLIVYKQDQEAREYRTGCTMIVTDSIKTTGALRVFSNDYTGKVSLAINSNAVLIGLELSIFYNRKFSLAPNVLLTKCSSPQTTSPGEYVKEFTDHFEIWFSQAPTNGDIFTYNYFIIEP